MQQAGTALYRCVQFNAVCVFFFSCVEMVALLLDFRPLLVARKSKASSSRNKRRNEKTGSSQVQWVPLATEAEVRDVLETTIHTSLFSFFPSSSQHLGLSPHTSCRTHFSTPPKRSKQPSAAPHLLAVYCVNCVLFL